MVATALACLLLAGAAFAESCATGEDIDATTRAALERTGNQFFGYLAHGDSASLRQATIPSLASNFAAISKAVDDRKSDLSGATAHITGIYLLDASDRQGTVERAEFLCGVWGANGLTPDSVAFMIPGLPAAKYAVILSDTGGARPLHVSYIVQQDPPGGATWRLAGMQVREANVGEHDGHWFAEQARGYQAKGQLRNAFFYYGQARELLAPVPFMTTLELQRLADAQQAVMPADLPAPGATLPLHAEGLDVRLTSVAPVPVGNGLDLVVRYQSSGAAGQPQVFANDVAVIKAFMQKYPEYRDAFAGVVARCEPSDPGALLPMSDIK